MFSLPSLSPLLLLLSSSPFLHVLLPSLLIFLPPLLYFIFSPYLSALSSDSLYPFTEIALPSKGKAQQKKTAPAVSQGASPPLYLSLVVPAYNESDRLPAMLSSTAAFLSSWPGTSSAKPTEIIVVSDGSTDATVSTLLALSSSLPLPPHVSLRVLSLTSNRGKGAAIRTGVLASSGSTVLMVDADGATDITELPSMLAALSSLPPSPAGRCVVGSRAHLQAEATAERTLLRTVLMKSFHFFVSLLCSSSVHDTQCGFKLFDRRSALLLFSSLHLDRWAFDVELLTLASSLKVSLSEKPVRWREIEGSKLDTGKLALAYNSVTMLRDMVCVKACYGAGLWRVPEVKREGGGK